MKVNVVLNPKQKKLIESKLKKARQKRIINSIAFNSKLTARVKIGMIQNVLK